MHFRKATKDEVAQSTFLDIVFDHEGGYVDHPNDPGGPTNLGVTLKTLQTFRGDPTVSVADLKRLSYEEAGRIFIEGYWKRVNAADLPFGVDLSVADMAVNAGPARAVRILQRVVGTTQDGVMGPQTLSAVRKRDPKALIKAYSIGRENFYRSLSTWRTFGKGWTARIKGTEKAALALVSEGPNQKTEAKDIEYTDIMVALLLAVFDALRAFLGRKVD